MFQKYRDDVFAVKVITFLTVLDQASQHFNMKMLVHIWQYSLRLLYNRTTSTFYRCPHDVPDLASVGLIGRRGRANHEIRMLVDLGRTLQHEWTKIPGHVINRYVNSMRR